jgi:rRNA biogenesis protein RRP5
VNEFELVVSLADHHTAFVSCNRVSKHLEAVFKSFTDEESDDEEDKSKSISPPTLKDFYKVGDGVIGTIVAVQSGTEGKKRKRLELSLIPAQVNSDLSLDDLEVGMMIPGEIKSIEDRGYVDSWLSGLKTVKKWMLAL